MAANDRTEPLNPNPETTVQTGPYVIDTRYPRSVEGIIRIIAWILALVGVILASVAFGNPLGWYIFVGVTYLVYIFIVFVIEVFIPGIYVHRLIDAIISIVYVLFWAIAAIVATVFAARWRSGELGAAAAFGYVITALTVASVVFAIKTYQQYERGTKGSPPVIVIR